MTVSPAQPSPLEEQEGLGYSAGTDGHRALSRGKVGQTHGEKCHGPEILLEALEFLGPHHFIKDLKL